MSVEQFLQQEGVLFDVRSPCEYHHAHIPGSVSLPLFTDEERAAVGTTYKRQGHDAAVLEGLEYVGPKMADMARIIRAHAKKQCRVTCARGGMRSQSAAWLCGLLGCEVSRLDGGYKAYRNHVLAAFERPWSLVILGGQTGSGKTEYLQKIREEGRQVLDLEGIARHRGSTFGLMPGCSQPSSEQYENDIAEQLKGMNPSLPVFVEDESRMVGSCSIPKALYDQMDTSPLIWLEVEREKRLRRIVETYGSLEKEWLIERARCLQKRLGGVRLQAVIGAIESGAIREAASILLDYYDKAYLMSSTRHERSCVCVTENNFFSVIDNMYK